MPRNSSGSYTTPAGQPVTSGTTISAATHNALVGDLATEITDSLSRSGKGGMSAPIRTPDGTAAAPSHSFTSETGTGVFRKGAANPALAVTGSEKQEWTSTGTNITGNAAVSGNETVGGTLGVTGNTTLGGTLGVTGAATVGGTLGVTGNTTLGGTLGVTGGASVGGNLDLTAAANQSIWKTGGDLLIGSQEARSVNLYTNNLSRLSIASGGDITAAGNLTVQGTTGVTLTAGNALFTEGADQTIDKSGGKLIVKTTGANALELQTDGTTRLAISATGSMDANSNTITGLAAPSAASDAATKGYADALGVSTATVSTIMRRDAAGRVAVAAPSAAGDAATKGYVDTATDGSGSVVAGAGWQLDYLRLQKSANGWVVFSLSPSLTSGTGSTVCTLPVGYRPATNRVFVAGANTSTHASALFVILITGVVQWAAGVPTTGTGYGFSTVFSTV